MQQTAEDTFDDVQALFRQVNERVLEVNRGLGPTARLADFVCECRDPECSKRLTLSVAQFESVRGRPNHFIVRLGHGAPSEQIVQVHKGFAVVKRMPEAAAA